MVPRQLTAAGLARAALIGGVGAVLTVVLAVAASPVFPVGLAGIAEPHPGIDADWTALLLGAGGVLVATVGVAAWPAWRAAQVKAGAAGGLPVARMYPGRPSAVLAVTRSVQSVPAATGIRLALQRGAGRTAVPVRSAIAATAVGVVGLSAALGFSASLGYLLATPRLYGVDLGRARHRRAVRHLHRTRGAQHRRRPAHSGLVRDVRGRSADGQRDRGRRGDHRARS